jgi:hypothetical protein
MMYENNMKTIEKAASCMKTHKVYRALALSTRYSNQCLHRIDYCVTLALLASAH